MNGGIDIEKARKTTVVISYRGKNVTKKLASFLESFKYSDVASGESDSIDITLNNRDLRFMNQYMPKKGDKITASICKYNWNRNGSTKSVKCGTFVLDDLSFHEPPLTCSIGAVSAPVKGEFKSTKRTKVYKDIFVKQIAKQIANRAGIALVYDAPEIKIHKIEQSKTADSEFLSSICEDYGLGLKVYNGKIVIFDEEKYERRGPSKIIKRKSGTVISWDWNTTMQGTYTGAKVSYTDPDDQKRHHVTIGKSGRMLHVDVTAFSKKEAMIKAKAKLAAENKKRTTMSVTLTGDTVIYSATTIRIEGFGKLSGKYYVDKIEHQVSASSGYNQMLTIHKVGKRISTVVS